MRRVLGLLASALVVGVAIAAWRSRGNIGYIEIKTVPVTPASQTVLYIDSTKLAPIKDGSAIVRQRVGPLTLQADDLTGSLASLWRHRGEEEPYHHCVHLDRGAAAALPMPVQRHGLENDGSPCLRELSGRI